MIVKAYSVLDKKVRLFNAPFFLSNDDVAVRHFSMSVNSDGETVMGRFPEDFSLVRVGEFDMDNGVLIPEVAGPVPICTALDVKSKEDN